MRYKSGDSVVVANPCIGLGKATVAFSAVSHKYLNTLLSSLDTLLAKDSSSIAGESLKTCAF